MIFANKNVANFTTGKEVKYYTNPNNNH